MKEIHEFDNHKIEALIVGFIRSKNIPLAKLRSCLDVGSGTRPVQGWFEKIAGEDSRYIASETDEEIIKNLIKRGVDAVNPFTTERDLSSDLVIAKEVIEHLNERDVLEFLLFCKKNTKMIFALTAPNFEYWSNFRCKDQGMNFMPEHLAYLDPSSKDPHKHKFEVTPGVLANYFGKVFEDDVWSWKIYRAWPYMIQDQARSLSWRVFYKIFAIAYKDEVFASFVKGVSDA